MWNGRAKNFYRNKWRIELRRNEADRLTQCADGASTQAFRSKASGVLVWLIIVHVGAARRTILDRRISKPSFPTSVNVHRTRCIKARLRRHHQTIWLRIAIDPVKAFSSFFFDSFTLWRWLYLGRVSPSNTTNKKTARWFHWKKMTRNRFRRTAHRFIDYWLDFLLDESRLSLLRHQFSRDLLIKPHTYKLDEKGHAFSFEKSKIHYLWNLSLLYLTSTVNSVFRVFFSGFRKTTSKIFIKHKAVI